MQQLNPIIKADYPDPDVIRVDDTYYMISTTMHFFPGGAILRSFDLIRWEIASYVFERQEYSGRTFGGRTKYIWKRNVGSAVFSNFKYHYPSV